MCSSWWELHPPCVHSSIKQQKQRESQTQAAIFALSVLFSPMIRTHYVRVEGLHINVSDGAAGKRPDLGFVFESSSDLQ